MILLAPAASSARHSSPCSSVDDPATVSLASRITRRLSARTCDGGDPAGDWSSSESTTSERRPSPAARRPQGRPPSPWSPAAAEKYEKLEVIGRGVYGTVYLGRAASTGAKVAIKRMHVGQEVEEGVPARVLREAALLRGFTHPNVVSLLAVHYDGDGASYELVFEHVEKDLRQVLGGFRAACALMPARQMERYSRELIEGIHACHVRRILHRDLKPENILIGPDGLKICDFGLARVFSLPRTICTQDVVTIWYRAPEILLGKQAYGLPIDLWSAGCLVAEMISGAALFPGHCERGTVDKILQVVGRPARLGRGDAALHNPSSLPRSLGNLLRPEALSNLNQLEPSSDTSASVSASASASTSAAGRRPRDLASILLEARPELGPRGLDLVQGLLQFCPEARLTARRARSHDFFASAASVARPAAA